MGWLEIFEENTLHNDVTTANRFAVSVLVVDDDIHLSNGIEKYLHSKGYLVYKAKNALEALKIYKSQSPKIIITDVFMPGMNGIEFLRAVRDVDTETEVIVLTGYGDMKMAINALQNNASDFLIKPVDFEILLHSVNKSASHIKLKEDIKIYTQELEALFKDVHHSREYLETILQSSPNATITYDKDGLINSWNAAAERISGYSKTETIGKSVKEIFVFDKHLIDSSTSELGDVTKQNVVGQILTKNQKMRFINRNANILVDSDNNLIGGIESFYDTTEKTNSDHLLEKRYLQVQTINEIGKKVAASIEVDVLIDFLSNRLVNTFFESANIFFFLGSRDQDIITLRAASGILIDEVLKKYPLGEKVEIEYSFVGKVYKEGVSNLCKDMSKEKKLRHSFGKDVFSSYSFPIKSNFFNYGVLHIENSEKLVMDDSDIFMMETIAEYLAISIDKIELLEKITKQNRLLEKQAKDLKKAFNKVESQKEIIEEHNKNLLNDIIKAGEFQKTLLPEYLPQIEKYDFAVSFTPSSQLGGDFYDIFMINERFVGILVSDASGHGVSSAMLSAMFKMTLSKYSAFDLNPGSVFKKLNQDFCQVLQTGDFFTSFYGIIDLHKNKFIYSNAAHPKPLLYSYKTGDVIEIDSEGFLLGVTDNGISYETKDFEFKGKYRLLIYTDGLNEEVNKKNEFFGEARIKNSLIKHASKAQDKFLKFIIAELKKFSGKTVFSDDLTLLTMDIH